MEMNCTKNGERRAGRKEEKEVSVRHNASIERKKKNLKKREISVRSRKKKESNAQLSHARFSLDPTAHEECHDPVLSHSVAEEQQPQRRQSDNDSECNRC